MSATDSDNSIDWLASDDEENESEREAECTGRQSHAQATDGAPSPQRMGRLDHGCCSSGPVTGRDGSRLQAREASSCTETRHGDARGLLCHSEQAGRPAGRSSQHALKRPHSSVAEPRQEQQLVSEQSDKDRLFTRKCMELQCYIHPLSLILNGLRSGRYKERLSSFQESVAMDRIQRIMGVLQNPCMGEKYVNIILKMEEMLKSWFPNVKPRDQHTVVLTEEAAQSKKPKLSMVATTALVSTPVTPTPTGITASLLGSKALRVTDLTPPAAYSAGNLKWLHTSPICSPVAEQALAGSRHLPPPPGDSEQTQDSAVSSSTDSSAQTHTAPRGPPPLGKINAPCLERLLKSTESIITHRGMGGVTGSNHWS